MTLVKAIEEMKKMSNEDLLLKWAQFFNKYEWSNEAQEQFEEAMRNEILKRMGA